MPRYGPGVRLPDSSGPGTNGHRLVPGAFATLAEPLIAPPVASSGGSPAQTVRREAGGAPYRTGVVLGLGPSACYIGFAGPTAGAGVAGVARYAVLPVLRPEAVQLPTGVRIGAAGPWPVAAGDAVTVDATGITLGGWLITPARAWHPPRVAPAAGVSPAAVLASLRAAWPGSAVLPAEPSTASGDGSTRERGERIDRLDHGMPPSARARLHRACTEVAAGDRHPRTLTGLGPGLTPSGDDAIAGVLLTLRLLGRRERVRAIAEELKACLASTTDLSGSLLVAAAGGYAAPQLVRLLAGLGAGTAPARLRRLVADVLAIGHSSGADLLTGVHAVLVVSAHDHLFLPPRTKESA